ncbi:MAG: DoxX family protein [Nitrosomonas sp.]|uniref:DoxX family protein n=1 Tax=Nitrosomonas sp. TaxID=42353 RepID=UPI0020867C91|nr:DoxX family protein [Nitrosomonas sp.]MCW5597632.1 DoxX family protein [Nitrosomonas sp.]GJL76757.1 MAG: membrane protein [Nitrosomonas sp.]
MNLLRVISAPIGRIFIALIFVISGWNKLFAYTDIQGYMTSMGVSGELLPFVIGVELLAGLAVITGWQTRLAALALAGFSILSAVIFHMDFTDQIQFIMFMKNLAIAGGLLLLVANGPGAYAFDNRHRTD